MPPYNLAALNGRLPGRAGTRRDQGVRRNLEAVVYPINTNADSRRGQPDNGGRNTPVIEFISPGDYQTGNDEMRERLMEQNGHGKDRTGSS